MLAHCVADVVHITSQSDVLHSSLLTGPCIPVYSTDDFLQVYLISTKAGSVGINLTAAFRIMESSAQCTGKHSQHVLKITGTICASSFTLRKPSMVRLSFCS